MRNRVCLRIATLFLLSIFIIPFFQAHAQTTHVDYHAQAKAAKKYCQGKGLNTDFYILADLNIHSGRKRLFVWDIAGDSVLYSYLVSHGCGTHPWSAQFSKEKALVSNRDGSHCSALGRYIIGERAYSDWGIHVKYYLYGQDASNANALKREIVFHSWDQVPEKEVFPAGTPEGWGCPAVSDNAMRVIDKMLQLSKKRVLLWVIQS